MVSLRGGAAIVSGWPLYGRSGTVEGAEFVAEAASPLHAEA
jgi:hypothetical protein